ncbi:MAG: isoleucine--tRNA ligase [Defluviitaleaceae bacterium]|nr:isoleucine--tRNA ligase [Defluviitaleaceae bacterium]
MYKKVNTSLDFANREMDILDFWDKNKIFKKSIENSKGKKSFTFYDGPPTANGKPHIGHIHTRAIKDLIPRYKTMKGYNVLRKAGWDTHGLPVELGVEKELKISGKPEIEKYGVEKFIKKCKESVWQYEQEWKEVSKRVGFWLDMENPYITYDNSYIESVWWALEQIWNKDLIYKGHKVLPYCPRCGTGLSTHEVAQGYKDIEEDSIIVKFKLKNEKNTYLLAWTTTPWTLPSNVAACVHPTEDYAKVKKDDNIYILAKALVEKIFGENTNIIETVKGIDLEYTEYEPLFNFVNVTEKCFFVTCDTYVSLSDGTGIVHTAPAFGEDDSRIAKKYNLPFIQLVNEQGGFLENVTPWVGIFVKDADPSIIKHLQSEDKIFEVQRIKHSYPHCWRCNSPLLYYAREAWYISMTKLRDELVANNNTVNWMPDNVKEGRFGNFLQNVLDWGLSRERYWGTPLPIWECECGYKDLVGSVEKLEKLSGRDLKELDLHKPNIDNVILKCEKCNGNMKRVPDVIDCWFDSGSMPFAQFHYPFENKDLFDENHPADFISEGIDQTRGWFYSLMAISTAVFGKSPYKNVIVMGHTLDKNGKKMSKSLGNVVDPKDALPKYGADAVRWYFYAASSPWLSSRFFEDAVLEYKSKYLGTLWNTYAFYVLYANIDNFNPTEHKLKVDKLNIMDKWILSKLHSLIENLDNFMENYKVYESTNILIEFVDNLSNWYVRRSRERFWGSEMSEDKINAYMTLYTVIKTLILLTAPFTPFISEEIYQNIVVGIDKNSPISVHLCDFPIVQKELIDKDLEKDMDIVYNIVVLGRSARNSSGMKNRQPLQNIYVKYDSTLENNLIHIIKDELNIKKLHFIDDVSSFISYRFKPNLPILGPKHGNLIPKISKFLNTASSSLYSELKNGIDIKIEDKTVFLTEEDVLVEIINVDGYSTESGKGISVVLDTTLTAELIESGFLREIISKIQNMRKEADFEVTDKINLYYFGNEKLENVIEKNKGQILKEVLANNIILPDAENLQNLKEWDINGEKLYLAVEVC